MRNLQFLPEEGENVYSFSRAFIASSPLKDYEQTKQNLLAALEEEQSFMNEEYKVSSFNSCIEECEQRIKMENQFLIDSSNKKTNNSSEEDGISSENNSKSNNIEIEPKDLNYNNMKFFYQESNGNFCFLNPIDYDILLMEYEDPSKLPVSIKVL